MHTPETVKLALGMAEQGDSKCDANCINSLTNAHTQTGPVTRRILNNLLSSNEESYLEVGMFYGSSFASALHGNKVKCAYGIDRLQNGYEMAMKGELLEKVRKWHNPKNGRVVIHFEDCFEFDVNRILDPITVYFYDADHTKDGHRKGITHFWPCLAGRFVLLVDDWNWKDVREGTESGLLEVGAKSLYTGTFLDMDKYYNGLKVWLIEK